MNSQSLRIIASHPAVAAVLLLAAALLVVVSPAPAGTLAYWRMEGDGVSTPVAGTTQVLDTNGRTTTNTTPGIVIVDVSGNGNTVWAWDHSYAGHTYQSSVPATKVPLTGLTNRFSIENAGSFPACFTWSKYSHPTVDLETNRPLAWTIEASVRPTATDGFRTFIGRDGNGVDLGNTSLAPLYFQTTPGGYLRIAFTDVGGRAYEVVDTTALTTGNWYNVAAVSDGTTLKLYKDSGAGFVLIGSMTLTAGDTRLAYDTAGATNAGDTQWGWTLGRGRYGVNDGQGQDHSDRWFGNIDEVRISDAALKPGDMLFASTNVYVVSGPTPANLMVMRGFAGSFNLIPGGQNPRLQWRHNGVNLPNATNETYAILSAVIEDAGNYDVVITNSFGSSITSSVATATILPAPGTANITVNVASNLATVASTAYGIHASIYANQLGNSGLTSQLVQGGVKMIRYPGGGLADVFHWSVSRPALGNANGNGLSPWFGVTNSFGYMGPKTDFGSFAQLLASGQFQALITINYGSGLKYGSAGHTNLVVPTTNAEPPEAAAWVAYANANTNIFGTTNDVALGVDSQGNDWKTAGYWARLRAAATLGVDDGYNFLRLGRAAPFGIKHWEIGNETFGTGYYSSGTDGYSVNYAVAYPNGTYTRYGNPNLSPAAYGKGVKLFALLMKAVDPTIKIGAVVSTPPGDYSWDIYNGQRWTPEVLAQCATNLDFVIAHWYPNAGSLSDGSNLLAQVATTLPAMIVGTAPHTGTSSGLRDWINAVRADGTNVNIFMTEFNYNGSVTNAQNGQPIFGPVNALFAADAYTTWMELGVANADWLELSKNTFLGDSNPLTPGAAYYAVQLSSKLALGGDKLVKTTSDLSQLRVHAAARQDGKLGLMLLNQNPGSNLLVYVTVANTNLTTSGVKYEFGTNNFTGGSQTPSTAPSSNVVSSVSNSFSVTVPAYTMVVLTIPFAAPSVAPQITLTTPGLTNFVLNYTSQLANNYVLQSATNLAPPIPWLDLQTNFGNGGAQSFTNLIDPAESKKFFRVRAY